MNISTDLIVKGTAGALAAAAAIGTGIAAKNSGWFGSGKDLTIFDEELIKWLDKEGNDIVFTIKYKQSGVEEKEANSETSTSFASFINDKDEPVKISVKVDNTDTNLKGSGDKNSLRGLNKNKNWTWICEMTFKKDEDSRSEGTVNPDQINRVYGTDANDGKGLFKKLMKESTSAGSNSSKIKELKKDFIKNCAKARTKEENQTIVDGGESDDREVKTQKKRIGFVLSLGGTGKDWGGKTNELYFKDKGEFNKWFPEDVNS